MADGMASSVDPDQTAWGGGGNHLVDTRSESPCHQQAGHQMSRHTTKATKSPVCPHKTPISLGIRQVWSKSLLCALRVAKDLRLLHAHIKDWSDWASAQSDQTPSLIRIFAGRTGHFVGFVVLELKWFQVGASLHFTTYWSHYSLKGKYNLLIWHCFFIETLHTARRRSHWMKNEIKSVGHLTHCHGNTT